MSRSVNHVASKARRKKLLRLTRGYIGRNKNVLTVAKNRWEKGQNHAYVGRKLKKRDYRKLWIQRINAGTRLNGMPYSQFMGLIHKNNIALNRKTLADLAMNEPEVFAKIINKIKN